MKSFREYLAEGVNDPGILKAVFLAGGPGSGKSHVGDILFGIDKRIKTSLSTYGLKVVNSDPIFELLLRKGGIDPKQLADIESNNPVLWGHLTQSPDGPRQRARGLIKKQWALYMGGKLGLIIDGTGGDASKIDEQRKELEAAGYDTMMVFINTRLDVAKARNRNRARSLPDNLVTDVWNDAQRNIAVFEHMFGSSFHVVMNNDDVPPSAEIQKQIRRFIQSPVHNPLGQEWLRVARAVGTSK